MDVILKGEWHICWATVFLRLQSPLFFDIAVPFVGQDSGMKV